MFLYLWPFAIRVLTWIKGYLRYSQVGGPSLELEIKTQVDVARAVVGENPAGDPARGHPVLTVDHDVGHVDGWVLSGQLGTNKLLLELSEKL